MTIRLLNLSLRRLYLNLIAGLSISAFVITIYFLMSPSQARGIISTNVVISEFRVRGPNGGNDEFVELYNLSSVPVDIGGWKIRGSNNSGTISDRATIPSGTQLQPGCHYLLTNSSASGGPYSGSVPGDQTYTTGITDDGGIAVTLPDNSIIDQVGLSSGSAYKEGTPLASLGTSNLNQSYERKPGGAGGSATDTDNNSDDFQLTTPSAPQNSTSACITPGSTNPTGTGAANPNPAGPGDNTLLTVAVTPGVNPMSTGVTVTGDLSSIGGSTTQSFFNDGTNGDVTPADNTFTFLTAVSASITPGLKSIPVTITDAEGRIGETSISLNVQAPALVVISQIYGGGGNSGSTFTHDFIEIFNRGMTPVDLAGWSVQYTSAAGTTWQVTPLQGTLAPGQYYLVQEGSGGTSGMIALPAPDASGSIMMSSTSGKVALSSSTTPISGSGCPFTISVIDFVGYGGANCSEGESPAPTLSNTTAAIRARRGCRDTNNNSIDFSSGSPNPRNTASTFNNCSVPPPLFSIHTIQGSGPSSPLAGQEVTTTGIVTARKNNGLFLQAPDAEADSDPNTSEGIFVFTSSTPAAAVGDSVSVIGTVGEFFNLTQLSSSNLDVIVQSSSNELPDPIIMTTSILNPAGTLDQLERFEGMRVSAASLVSIAPTNEFGEIFTMLTGVTRALREPGIEVSLPLPPGAPCCVPRFDQNPERLMVDTDGQIGSTRLQVTSNVTLTGVTGPLDFAFGDYKVLPDAQPVASANLDAIPVPIPNGNEFTIASFNMRRFFNTTDDPGDDEVLTPEEFSNRLNKSSLAIRNVMRSPDVIGVQEVENQSTLQEVANKVNGDTVAAGLPNPNYQAFVEEGNDVGGIDVGFLVKTSRINVVSVTQVGKTTTFINPLNGQPETLNDRPPLILRAAAQSPTGSTFAFTVIVNHLRSLIDIDQDPGQGPRVREKRRKQAEFLANLTQSLQAENLTLVGDFNAFQINDGYVDVIGTVKGAPTPSDQVVLASVDLVEPNLTSLVDTIPADQRYSFICQGNGQVLDHVLIDGEMRGRLSRFAYARNNADFPEFLSSDPTRPERISDHDNPVAYFTFPPPSADLAITITDAPDPVLTSSTLTYTITLINNGPDNTTDVVVSDALPAGVTFISCNATGGGVCSGTGNNRVVRFSSLNSGATGTITLTALVNGLLLNGAVINNTAMASSAISDPDSSNNSATSRTTVNRSQSISPVAECVIDLGGGAFTARFGYDNPNPVAITIPNGIFNMFIPPPQDRGQITTFLPGRQRNTFSIENLRGVLVWTLNGRVAIASSLLTPRCDQ